MYHQLPSLLISLFGIAGGIGNDSMMMRLFLLIPTITTLLITSSCTMKTSEEVTANLWSNWVKAEEQMQQDFPDAPPLILVHGWNGDEGTWPAPDRLIALEMMLQRDIFLFTYRTAIYPNRFPPLEVIEEQFDQYLAPFTQVDVIAHSMGGLMVRHYLSQHSDSPVRRLVFLATPHFGSNAALWLLGIGSTMAKGNIQANEIQPGSDFLWLLNSVDGSELEHVEVLNAYIRKESLIKSDLVVPQSSSYLPWADNITVAGPHHTLGERLESFPRILDFISSGTLPVEFSSMPERKDAWLRFRVNHAGSKVSENNFKAYDARGIPSHAYKVCCTMRSGLYDDAASQTVIIENLEAGFSYSFRTSTGSKTLIIKADELMNVEQPVNLKEFSVDNAAVVESVDQSEGERGQ